jgi:hypothetical protein
MSQLKPGLYRLKCDVVNPGCDKRFRDDWRVSRTEFHAGEEFFLRPNWEFPEPGIRGRLESLRLHRRGCRLHQQYLHVRLDGSPQVSRAGEFYSKEAETSHAITRRLEYVSNMLTDPSKEEQLVAMTRLASDQLMLINRMKAALAVLADPALLRKVEAEIEELEGRKLTGEFFEEES